MEPSTEPTYTIVSGGRPIDSYPKSRFMPNDMVYIRAVGDTPKEGPYTVASADQGAYTLCNAQGQSIQSGKSFQEKDLEEYNEFE